MVPAIAIAGTPNTAAAAAPRNAFLDDSAFNDTEERGVEVTGEKAAAEPTDTRVTRAESFILVFLYWHFALKRTK
jgi:hypothetical protein